MSIVAPRHDDLRERTTGVTERRPATAVLAVFLPAAALLLMLGEALTPEGLDKPTTTATSALRALTIAARQPNRVYLSNLLVIFGLGALGVSFTAIATLAPRKDRTLATTAAVIGGSAAFCGALANMLVGFNVAAAASAHTAPTAAAQVLLSADRSAVATILLAGYLVGGATAIALSSVALWRSTHVPRWLPALFGGGLILAAGSRPGITAVFVQLPFALAMVLLAARIWTRPLHLTRGASDGVDLFVVEVQ